MLTVHKFPLVKEKGSSTHVLDERFYLEIPSGAKPLCVHLQGKHICIWFLLDTAKSYGTRTFAVYGTGWGLPEPTESEDAPLEYIGTVHDGAFDWHVFEVDP